jgi:hypothetical protein
MRLEFMLHGSFSQLGLAATASPGAARPVRVTHAPKILTLNDLLVDGEFTN